MSRRKPRPPCKAECGRRVNLPTYTYCSVKCQQAFHRRALIETFLRGDYPPAAYTGQSFIRRYLIDQEGEHCARCGWRERNPVTGRVPLELEHIDGDWRNNRPDNLTLLCPNCHSLTPTFKALNKGRGREYRQERRLRQRASGGLDDASARARSTAGSRAGALDRCRASAASRASSIEAENSLEREQGAQVRFRFG
jgi:hypothetical protein